MECFICEKTIVPEKGYFKTQMWNSKLICHDKCRPTFYWDNKPEEKYDKQPELWREQK